MLNKHEKRVQRESLHASSATRKTTVEDTGDVHVLTVEESGPQLVRLAQQEFQSLPVDGQSYIGHNFRYRYGVIAAAGVYPIGNIVVPKGMALDVSETRYHLVGQNGLATSVMPDFGLRAAVSFVIDVNGHQVWDQFSVNAAGGRRAGWNVLNQNVFESWSDIKTHLVATEQQTVTWNMLVWGAVGVGYLNDFNYKEDATIEAHMRGRWIPLQLWRDVIRRNRGGGENE